ncbi:ATP-binding protein [Priestia megaterium]
MNNKLKRKSISTQFIFLASILLLAFAAGSTVLVVRQKEITADYAQYRAQVREKAQLLSTIDKSMNRAFLQARGFIAFDSEDMYNEAASQQKSIEENLDRLSGLAADRRERTFVNEATVMLNTYFNQTLPYFKDIYDKKGIEGVRSSPERKAASKSIEQMQKELDDYQNELTKDLNTQYDDTSSDMQKSQTFFILFLAFTVVILLLLTRVLLNKFVKPLSQLAYTASEIAAGKEMPMTFDEHRRDEIGMLSQAFYKMVSTLQNNEQELTAQNEELIAQQDELHSQQDELQHALELTKEREGELELRNLFVHGLTNSLHKQEVLTSAVTNMSRVMKADHGFIMLTDEKTHASFGLSSSSVKQMMENLHNNYIDHVQKTKKCMVVKRECIEHERLYHRQTFYLYDVIVPVLSSQGDMLAYMFYSRYADEYTEHELQTFEILAKQITIALEKIYIYEESEHDRLLSQDILNSIQEGMQLVDTSGTILQVNTKTSELFQYEHQSGLLQLSRDQWLDALSQKVENIEELRQYVKAICKGEQVEKSFVYYLHTEGKRKVIKVYSEYVYRNRQMFGVLFVHRDITKEFEVDQMKSEFVSTVSHELRTPLASVLGFTELMLNKTLKEERQKKYLTTIYQEAQRLTSLINDFLDVQRMEAGKQTYDKKYQDILPLIKQVIEVQNIQTSKHEFNMISDQEHFTVMGDKDKLLQLFNNVISNAVKYSPDGGNVTVKVYQKEHAVYIDIQDEGIGIPSEALGHLFTKFYRVDNSDMRKIGGTGLGLAIVKEIVKAHGGDITVQSEWKKGTTFTIVLPLLHEVQYDEEMMISANDNRKSVVIVEDDKSLATLLQVELKESGFHVRYFNSGEDALNSIHQQKPEVVVLDIMLGENKLDGWDVLRHLKENTETEKIPILISSALDERSKGLELGVCEFLIKPYQPSKLSKTILQLLLKKQEHEGEIMIPSDKEE